MSTESSTNESKAGQPNNKLVEDLLRNLFAPTAVLSGLGYFLGWTFSAAYYLSFGFLPSSISKSVPEILASAWVELGIAVLILTLGFLIDRWLSSLVFTSASKKKNLSILLNVFFGLFIFTLLGSIAFIYVFFVLRLSLRYLLIASVVVAISWSYCVLGREMKPRIKEIKHRLVGTFEFIFPNFYVVATLTIFATIFLLNRFAIWRGVSVANIDVASHTLPVVILYSSEPLLPFCIQETSTKQYVCKDLFLIDSNENFLFVYQKDNSVNTPLSIKTFMIARENIKVVEHNR